MTETGPIPRSKRAPTAPSTGRRRLPTAPMTPLSRSVRRGEWARAEAERCTSTCGDDRRCMLREAHGGLHVWRSLGALRTFEWS